MAEKATAATKPAEINDKYKWFDIFYATPRKTSVANPYNPQQATVIVTSFELGKKVKSVAIEPRIALDMSLFVTGWDAGNGGKEPMIYLEKDKYTNGDILQYPDYAAMMRKHPDPTVAEKFDAKTDTNLVLRARVA